MPSNRNEQDTHWSSEGLAGLEAASQWRSHFAARKGTPVEVAVRDPDDGFIARWVNRGLGRLRLLRILGPAQTVTHRGTASGPARADHLFHMITLLSGEMTLSMENRSFRVGAGEATLIDNASYYRFEIDSQHEVIDLICPLDWLERHIPEPRSQIGRVISMEQDWGVPLASMLGTLTASAVPCPLPLAVVAEQVGALMALAFGVNEQTSGSPTVQLTHRIMRRIETDFANPDLTLDGVASDLGISRRYLQALLAGSGTSFVRELNALRLDHAANLLNDPRAAALQIAEVAWRCGFEDSGYFTRIFRKRFGATPRRWRELGQKLSTS